MPVKGGHWSETQRQHMKETLYMKDRKEYYRQQEWSFDFDIREDYE